MKRPEAILIGFFPKNIYTRMEGFKNPILRDICSVSNCISGGPDGWIDKWEHNDWGLYDTREGAKAILGPDDIGFTMFAYKLFPFLFDDGPPGPLEVVSTASGQLEDFAFLGYDIVSRSLGNCFECSPLSCNGGYKEITVNKHCLIEDSDTAWTTAEVIALEAETKGSWEPGPYCLLEVYQEKKI
jgi:hypothetical protein